MNLKNKDLSNQMVSEYCVGNIKVDKKRKI